jgi:DNA-binding response OmpR family regulator
MICFPSVAIPKKAKTRVGTWPNRALGNDPLQTEPLQILIVEDHEALAAATARRLSECGHRVAWVHSAEDVDDAPIGMLPDVYIIDINLPGEDGLSLAGRIRAAQPSAGIVMMTARTELEDRLSGFTHGADHYLGKPVDPRELLACIRVLSNRLQAAGGVPGGRVDVREGLLHGESGAKVHLTQREMLLLAALARAPDHSLERWQLMQLIDPYDKGLSAASVEMMISALRKKLIAIGAPDTCLRAVRGWGYKLLWPLLITGGQPGPRQPTMGG